MNALFLDRDGGLFDPMNGRTDAMAGQVRFIGAPATRLAEDILRLLRFYRLHATYGAGLLDPVGRAACRAAAGDLPRLSGERVAGELIKLLAAPRRPLSRPWPRIRCGRILASGRSTRRGPGG